MLPWALLTAFLAVGSGNPLASEPTAPAPLLSGCERDYPPFCLVHEDGSVDGFSVELLRAALGAMGREVTFRTESWAEVKGWLERGDVQALPLVGRTPEREALFDFTVPYLTMHGAIVVRRNTTGIAELNDLRGHRVAVMKGDNTEEFLRREDRGLDILTAPTFTDALQDLSSGRCEAVVVQRLVALRLLAEHHLNNLRILDRPIEGFSQDFCFAVREGDRDTLAWLNEGLALVVADGTHRRLHVKWFATLELPSNRPIVIGGDYNFPPFEYLDGKGRPAGLAVELTQALAREMGLDVRIRLGPWTEIVHGLDSGEIDAIQGIFHTDEREQRFDFTPPYLTANYVSVVRRGEGQPPETVAELAGRSLVVQADDAILEIVDRQGLRNPPVVVATQEEVLRAVAEGRQDCALAVRPSALHLIQKNGWTNLALGTRSFFSGQYCYGVKEGRSAMVSELAEGLQIVKHSGRYREIHERWLGIYEPARPPWLTILKYMAMVAVPLLAIASLALAWSWSLRHQVAERTAELASQYRLLQVAGGTARFGGWSIDLAANRLTWSDLVAQIHDVPRGYSPTVEEGIGFYAPEWREKLTRALTACTRNGTPFDEETEILTARNRRVWVRTTGEAVRDTSGRITRVQGAFQDITERKQAQDRLRADAAELQARNEQLERFQRATLGRELRMTELKQEINELCRTGGQPERYPTGSPEESARRDVARVTSTHQDRDRLVETQGAMLNLIEDATAARDRAEQANIALRESELRYRMLFEESPISLWEEDCSEVKRWLDTLRESGIADLRAHFTEHPEAIRAIPSMVRVLNVNRATLRLCEVESKDQLLSGWFSAWTSDSLHVLREALLAMAEGQVNFSAESTTRTLNGRAKPVEVQLTIAPSFEQTWGAVYLSVVDLTERKQVEARTKLLAGLGLRLGAARQPVQAAQAVADAALDLIGWDACFLDLYDRRSDSAMEVLNMATFEGRRAEVPHLPPEKRPTPLFRRILSGQGELLLREGLDGSDTIAASGDNPRPSLSFIFVPVRLQGETIGVFSIQSYRSHAYTQQDLGMLQGLADHCAEALVRLQQEAALEEEAVWRRVLVDQSSDGIVVLDETGRVFEANRRYAEMLGYPSDEVRRLHVWDWDAQHSREQLEAMLREVDDGGAHIETRHRRKDGTVFDVEISTNGALVTGRKLVFCVCRDITQRKEAEAESALLTSVLAASVNEIYIFDADTWHFRFVSAGAQRNLGHTPEQLRQMTPLDLMADFDRDSFAQLMRPLLTHDRKMRLFEAAHRRADGSQYPVEVRLQLFEHGDERVFLAVGMDITERRQMELHLRQQQRLESIGTLASGVAHEINNPITGIMNYAQLIQDRLPPDSRLKEFSGEIMHETQRVATIVRNLLTFARNEKLSHCPARMADIVAGTLSLVQTVLRRDQITLTVSVPEDLPSLSCCTQQIQQVLMNLVTNARDALNSRYPGHHPDKVIILTATSRVREERAWIRMTVEDHGTGIQPEVRNRMFDPFFTTKPRDEGTGLGLAISHGIVKEHHGVVTVETEPARFTRIHVDLPVNDGRDK